MTSSGLEVIGENYPLHTHWRAESNLVDKRVPAGRLPRSRTHIIPSSLHAYGRFAERYTQVMTARFGDRGFEIAMAVNEMLENVVDHANHCDPTKKGYVIDNCINGRLFVAIYGEGELYSFAPHKGKRDGRGWGKDIMGPYTNGIALIDGGRGVIMVFEEQRPDVENPEVTPEVLQQTLWRTPVDYKQ